MTIGQQPVERLTLSVAEAAEALGLSRSAVYDLIRTGRIPAVRVSPRRTQIHRAKFLAWVEAGGLDAEGDQ